MTGPTPREFNPGARCDIRVEGGTLAYPCTLPRDHDGPHYAIEIARSRKLREDWLRDRDAGLVDQTAKVDRSVCSVCRADVKPIGKVATPHERAGAGVPSFCRGSGKEVIYVTGGVAPASTVVPEWGTETGPVTIPNPSSDNVFVDRDAMRDRAVEAVVHAFRGIFRGDVGKGFAAEIVDVALDAALGARLTDA